MKDISAYPRVHASRGKHPPASGANRHRVVLDHCRTNWGLEIGPMSWRQADSTLFNVRVRGRDAILKLTSTRETSGREIRVLQAASGRGYAHLFDHDEALGALLLEKVGPSMGEQLGERFAHLAPEAILPGVQAEDLQQPLVSALQEAWTLPLAAAPENDEHTHKAARHLDLMRRVSEQLTMRERYADAIARAEVYAEQRLEARSASHVVVCHGRAHVGNLRQVLAPRPGAPGGFVWVNPDPHRCEPEHDLGVALRDANKLLLATEDPVVRLRGWCAGLAAATGTDAEAIWQWAFIDRVAGGLSLIERGKPERGRPYLDAAAWLIARKRP